MQNNDELQTFSPERTENYWNNVEKRMSSADVYLEAPDGKLLIVKATYKPYWSLPGGAIDHGETPKQAAVREVMEEVGIHIDATALKFQAIVDRFSDARGHTYQFIFRTTISNEQVASVQLQTSEIHSFDTITREELLAESRTSESRVFGNALYDWAHRRTGYIEHTFTA